MYNFQSALYKPIDTKIQWNNYSYDAPIIYLFFQSDFQDKNQIENFYIQIDIPFITNIQYATWGIYDDCQIQEPSYQVIVQQIQQDFDYSYYYLQLINSLYEPNQIYYLRLEIDSFMDIKGFSKPLKLKMISTNKVGYIIYAKNDSFHTFFAEDQPKQTLVIQEIINDESCYEFNQQCQYIIELQIVDDHIYKIQINLKGDYIFDIDLINDTQILQESSDQYIEYQDDNINIDNSLFIDKSLSIVITNINKFEQKKILILMHLKTPILGGQNKLQVLMFSQFAKKIINSVNYNSQLQTKQYQFQQDYPKLYFSMGLNANDNTIPYGIGLYSIGSSYQLTYNTLQFFIQIDYQIQYEKIKIEDKDFYIEIYLGTSNILLPLGYINNNFKSFDNLKIKLEQKKNKLIIYNIQLEENKEYYINFNIAFQEEGYLDDDNNEGFGVIKYLYKNKILIKQTSIYKNGFNKIFNNQSLILQETIDKNIDNYYKGFNSFRTIPSNGIQNNIQDYNIDSQQNGLFKDSNIDIFFRSAIGPNHLYYTGELSDDHNGERTVIDIITNHLIQQQNQNFDDSNAVQNCRIYIAKLGVWSEDIQKSHLQNLFDPTNTKVVTIEPNSYNPIGGCSIRQVTMQNGNVVTNMRIRFRNLEFKDQNGDSYKFSGARVVLADNLEMENDTTKLGNIYVFRNVQILDQPRGNLDNLTNRIFDIFIRLYFFSSIIDNNKLINAMPNVQAMENLKIFSNENSFLNPDFKLTMHNIYYNKYNDYYGIDKPFNFPQIFQIHGKFTNLNLETSKILLKFDFLKLENFDNNINCSSHGITLNHCKYIEGIDDFQIASFQKFDRNFEQIYQYTSELNNGILIDIDKTSLENITDFSIVFIFEQQINTNITKFLFNEKSDIKTYPQIITYDDNFNQIQRQSFESFNQDFSLYTFNSNYENPSLTQLTQQQVESLDDQDINNDYDYGLYISSNNLIVGNKMDLNLNIQCNNCVDYTSNQSNYHTATFCSDFNFDNEDFSFNENLLQIEIPHILIHQDMNCIFINQISNGLKQYDIKNFQLPLDNGLIFTDNTIGLISQNKVQYLNKLKFQTQTFQPNVIQILDEQLSFKKFHNSFLFQTNLKFGCEIKKQFMLQMKKFSGDFLFFLKGNQQYQYCYIQQEDIINQCSFQIVQDQLRIFFMNDYLKDIPISIKLYGLSTIQNQTALKLDLKIQLFKDGNDLSNINNIVAESSEMLNIVYENDTTQSLLQISNLIQFPQVQNVLGYIQISLNLIDKQIFKNEEIIIDFGQYIFLDNTSCYIQDPLELVVLDVIDVCQVIDLKKLLIKFKTDNQQKNFLVTIQNINMPQERIPGIQALYTFNDQQIIFESNIFYYKEFQDAIHSNKADIIIQRKSQGFKNDLNIKFQLEKTLTKNNQIYIIFNTQCNFKNNKLVRSFTLNFETVEIQLKIYQNKILLLEGFENDLDNNIIHEILIQGLKCDFQNLNGYIYFFNKEQNQIQEYKEFIIQYNEQQNENVNDMQIIQSKMTFNTIRGYTDMLFHIKVNKKLSFNQNILINLEFLEEEIYRPFDFDIQIYNINNEQYKIDQGVNQLTEIPIDNIKQIGNNLYGQLQQNSQLQFLLIIKNVPTPDYKICELRIPIIQIINQNKKKLLFINPTSQSNFDNLQLLDENNKIIIHIVQDNVDQIYIYKGFFSKIKIESLNLQKSEFFKKQLSFQLSSSKKGMFSLQKLTALEITSEDSQVGYRYLQLALGCDGNVQNERENLIVLKNENGQIQYTDLPLLKINIISIKFKFELEFPLIVYRGGQSLPLLFKTDLIPYSQTIFRIKFLQDYGDQIQLRGGVNEFYISQDFPYAYITFTSKSELNVNIIEFLIEPKEESSIYETSFLSLQVIDSISINIKFIPTVREIEQFGVKLDFSCNTEVLFIYSLQPESEYYKYEPSYIKNLYLKGILKQGNSFFRLGIIYNKKIVKTFFFNDLRKNTKYFIQGFYQSPIDGQFVEFNDSFNTIGTNDQNGLLFFNFNQILYQDQKRNLLCKFASQYEIAYENLWSEEGFNCSKQNEANYEIENYNYKERAFNTTLNDINILSNEENNKDELLENLINQNMYLKQMTMKIYEPLVQYQNYKIYNHLQSISQDDNFIHQLNDMLGEIIIEQVTSLEHYELTNKPTIQDIQPTLVTDTSIKFQNLTLKKNQKFLAVLTQYQQEQTMIKEELLNIQNFEQFILKKTEKFDIEFKNLITNQQYIIYYITMNTEHQKHLKISDIKYMTFTASEQAYKKQQIILLIKLVLIYSFYQIIFNIRNQIKGQIKIQNLNKNNNMQRIILAFVIFNAATSINFQMRTNQTTQQNNQNEVDLERQRAEMERRTQELQAQIEQVQQQVSAQEQENDDLTVQIQERQGELVQLNSTLSMNENKVTQLTMQLKVSVNQNKSLQVMITDLRTRIGELQAEDNANQAELVQLQAEAAALEQQYETLQAEVAQWEDKLTQQDTLMADLRAQVAELTAANQANLRELMMLEAQNRQLKSEYEALKAEYKKVVVDEAIVAKNNKQLKAQLAEFRREFGALQAEYDVLVAQRDQQAAALNAARQQRRELGNELNFASQQRDADQATLRALQQTNRTLQAQVDNMRQQNAKLSVELSRGGNRGGSVMVGAAM